MDGTSQTMIRVWRAGRGEGGPQPEEGLASWGRVSGGWIRLVG